MTEDGGCGWTREDELRIARCRCRWLGIPREGVFVLIETSCQRISRCAVLLADEECLVHKPQPGGWGRAKREPADGTHLPTGIAQSLVNQFDGFERHGSHPDSHQIPKGFRCVRVFQIVEAGSEERGGGRIGCEGLAVGTGF